MDKIHVERKMNIQNKNMIKTLEFQNRKQESEVQSLLKLKRQTDENNKALRDLNNHLDVFE